MEKVCSSFIQNVDLDLTLRGSYSLDKWRQAEVISGSGESQGDGWEMGRSGSAGEDAEKTDLAGVEASLQEAEGGVGQEPGLRSGGH